MRGWLVGLGVGLAIAGCGAARTGHHARDDDEHEPIVRAMPSAEAYEVISRTRVSFAEHELATLRSRVHLFVEERSRRGLSLRARVFRLGEGETAEAYSDVDVDLDRRGRFVREPLSRCDDPDVDDLSPTRVVELVLGSIAPWDGAPDTEISFDVAEPSAAVSLRTERDGDRVRARGSASVRLGTFAVAGWRIRTDGEAHVEVDERLDASDALVVRSRLLAETIATVMDREGRTRTGVLEIALETIVRASDLAPPSPESCDAGFSAAHLRAAVDLRHDEVRACYEAALAADPTLEGAITVELTVLPLGEVTAARAVRDDLGVPAVTDCIARVLESIELVEGPVGETRFVVPFSFTPTD